MIIYFLTKQAGVCRRIARRLELLGCECQIFENIGKFFITIRDTYERPGLLLIDILMYRREQFNSTKVLEDRDIYIPLIYYNDPHPAPRKRVEYWMDEIYKLDYNINLKEMKKYIICLSDALTSPDIFPYVSLLQQPLPFPENEDEIPFDPNQEENKPSQTFSAGSFQNPRDIIHSSPETFLYMLRKKHNMPASVFSLFCLLYQNKSRSLCTEQISRMLSGSGKERSVTSVNVALSRIRQIINMEKDFPMDIIRDNEGYKLVLL